MELLPDGLLKPGDLVMEHFKDDYLNLFAKHKRTNSDVPWAAFPIMTIPWVEAIIGCPIIKKGNNIWAEASMKDHKQAFPDEFDISANGWLDKLLEFSQWLIQIAEGRFPVSVSLMRGPIDLLSALRGPTNMVYDFYDFPNQTAETLGKLTEIWEKIANAQLNLISAFKEGYSFGVIYLWGQEKGGWIQDDAIAFLSPKFYEAYALPNEEKLAACMPLTGMHLHPNSLYVVNNLLAIPTLKVIEVNYEPTGPKLDQLMPVFKKIIEKKKLAIWGDFSNEDLILLLRELPPKNLCLQVMAGTPEEANAKIRKIHEIWQE
jgi:hypothetical protein